MKNFIWLGTEAAYELLHKFEKNYQFDKVAYSRSPFDDPPKMNPEFMVMDDRIGLYLLEQVGETTVIKVHGSLTTSYARWHNWYPGEVTSYEAIKDALQIVMEAGKTKVLMDFSTGGGAVRGLDTVSKMMEKVRKSGVRLDTHTDDASFSAGYWLMAGGRQVTASVMAEQGSIGTMAVIRTYANTEENFGIKFTVLRAGEFKALGNPFEDLTEEAKAYLQKNIEKTNEFFLNHVSAKRSLDLADKAKWAEGRTFFSGESLALGLIDKIATLDDLIGSGAAANKPSDNRRYEMKISEEKLAQIAAGAAPETVLNDAELKQYNADLEAAKTAEEEAKTQAKETKPKEGEDAGNKTQAKTGEEGDEEPKVEGTGVSLQAEFKQALKENGKLESKVEALETQLKKMEEERDAAKAEANSLLVLGQAAVQNLQVALRMPKEARASAAEVLAQYNDLQGKMATTFKTGQQSKESSTEDNVEATGSAAWRFSNTNVNNTKSR